MKYRLDDGTAEMTIHADVLRLILADPSIGELVDDWAELDEAIKRQLAIAIITSYGRCAWALYGSPEHYTLADRITQLHDRYFLPPTTSRKRNR